MTKSKKHLFILLLTIVVFGYLYQYSPWRIEFLGYYDKVYAHRVNSLEKQNEALKYFDGIEFDLIYDKAGDILDVNHLPAKSIHLTFEDYINNIDANAFPFLWLDIKRMDSTISNAVYLKVNTLLESKNYPKNKVLIESRTPSGLPKFTAAGYKTSYYLKPNLYKLKEKDLAKEIHYIASVIEAQPNVGISASYNDYHIMSQYFPDKTKYLWALTSPYRIKFNKARTVLKDKTVAIVLSSFKSFSGNR